VEPLRERVPARHCHDQHVSLRDARQLVPRQTGGPPHRDGIVVVDRRNRFDRS
jgi:hypothetical protein